LSTLYIRLPSKAAADNASDWLALACPFALLSNSNAIEHQGTAPLSDISDAVAKSQRIVLLLAASDVTLLHMKVPPLSPARLKAALPNLVEDQLIADPADCVVVAGSLSGVSADTGGLRPVAVAQRAWLDTLAKTLVSFGARHIAALPAQLCLPYQPDQPGSVISAINVWNEDSPNADIDMTLRLSEQDGIGLAINGGQNETATHEVIRTLCAVVPEAPITLYVPQSSMPAYQEAVNDSAASNNRISVSADEWSNWISGASATTLDLLAGLRLATSPGLNWRAWRWPLALAAAVLLVNVTALNIDWLRLKGESKSLRSAMIQIYKSAYPNESVIIDPIAQMQQKIAAAKRNSGQAAPDDFTAITAAFGEAWSGAAGKPTSIASLEYHERSLFVHLKLGAETPTQQVKAALATRDLALDPAPEQSGAVVWKIRSAK
jgi:general secretion pathway protein L